MAENGFRKWIKSEVSLCMMALRRGLMLVVPFLFLGSFSVVFLSFPVPQYQKLLEIVLDGQLVSIFNHLYDATLGCLAGFLIMTVSVSYGRQADSEHVLFYPIVAFSSYIGFTGIPESNMLFSVEWILCALIITLSSCLLLKYLSKRLDGKFSKYITGTDYYFYLVMQSLIPILIIVSSFVVIRKGLTIVLDHRGIDYAQPLVIYRIFERMGRNIFSVLLYIIVSHILWFFGVHGTNVLEKISTQLFEQSIEINSALIIAGKLPDEIFSKTFMDVFVFMGGCGTTLCFLLALLVVSKKSSNRKLGKLSLIPVFFNINETLLFGYPIIFNWILLIPFIVTPVVMACISSLLMYLGLVPVVSNGVGWTVPVLFSGYYATGSLRGSLLQVINILVGIALYIPFIKWSDKKQEEKLVADIRRLERDLVKSERRGKSPKFLVDEYPYYISAKSLAMDLRVAIENGDLQMYYQPQVDYNDNIFGGEALLRWNHPVAGFIMPPLIIQLANEEGIINQLGHYIIEAVLADIHKLEPNLKHKIRISINISPNQLDNIHFVKWVSEAKTRAGLEKVSLMFEFTEQVALTFDDTVRHTIKSLIDIGIEISMDDFGMGHGSIMYLNESSFQEVKLDGKLVKQMVHNIRSREIIKAITNLSTELDFHVIAEYVETVEQKELLHDLGCNLYQGYLYSPPIPMNDFIKFITSEQQDISEKR